MLEWNELMHNVDNNYDVWYLAFLILSHMANNCNQLTDIKALCQFENVQTSLIVKTFSFLGSESAYQLFTTYIW